MTKSKYKKFNEEKYQLWRERVMLMEEERKKLKKTEKYPAAAIAIQKHGFPVSVKYLVRLWGKWKKNGLRVRKKVLERRGKKPMLSDRLEKILHGILGEHLIHHEKVDYKLVQELAKKYLGVVLSNATTARFLKGKNLVSRKMTRKPRHKISWDAMISCHKFRDEVAAACPDITKLYAMDETALYNNEVTPRTLVEKG